MTKQEAIQAMEEGYKVTHRYFSPSEFLKLHSNGYDYETEEGYTVSPYNFFNDRPAKEWETDWQIWQDPTSEERGQDRESDENSLRLVDDKGLHQMGYLWLIQKVNGSEVIGKVHTDYPTVAEDLVIRYNAYPSLVKENQRLQQVIREQIRHVKETDKENQQLKEQLTTGANQYAFAEATRQQQSKDIEELIANLKDCVKGLQKYESLCPHDWDKTDEENVSFATKLINRITKK